MRRKIKLQGHVKLRLCSDPFGQPTERSKQTRKRAKENETRKKEIEINRNREKEGKRERKKKKEKRAADILFLEINIARTYSLSKSISSR